MGAGFSATGAGAGLLGAGFSATGAGAGRGAGLVVSDGAGGGSWVTAASGAATSLPTVADPIGAQQLGAQELQQVRGRLQQVGQQVLLGAQQVGAGA